MGAHGYMRGMWEGMDTRHVRYERYTEEMLRELLLLLIKMRVIQSTEQMLHYTVLHTGHTGTS